MNTRVGTSTSSTFALSTNSWKTILLLVLAFWLSSSLMLDLIIMPSLYATGMMNQPGFAGAGYLIFWFFNRLELVCAALVLTGLLVIRSSRDQFNRRGYIGLVISLGLLAIPLIYTYGLTPQMSALGLQLNLFNSVTDVPTGMNQLHESYWLLEMVKLALGGLLVDFCARDRL